ncbi:MAG: flagellar biosynthetic protein FliO [Bryobacteraceae bacterium]
MELSAMSGIIAVFTLLAVTLAAFRRLGWAGSRFLRHGEEAAFLHVIASHRLEPGKTLYALAVAGRILVVATHPSGCSVLTSIDPQAAGDPATVEEKPE